VVYYFPKWPLEAISSAMNNYKGDVSFIKLKASIWDPKSTPKARKDQAVNFNLSMK